MASILLALLLNPASLWTIAALCGLTALAWFTVGPAQVIKIASDIRTWFALALVLAIMAFAHAEKRSQALEDRLDAAIAQATADRDAQASLERRAEQRESRRRQDDRITERIDQAPAGQKHDAALDGIAAERPDYHGPQNDQDLAGDPAGPAADGMRKHPDGAVLP